MAGAIEETAGQERGHDVEVVAGDVSVRQATSDDVEFVQKMLYQAANRP